MHRDEILATSCFEMCGDILIFTRASNVDSTRPNERSSRLVPRSARSRYSSRYLFAEAGKNDGNSSYMSANLRKLAYHPRLRMIFHDRLQTKGKGRYVNFEGYRVCVPHDEQSCLILSFAYLI